MVITTDLEAEDEEDESEDESTNENNTNEDNDLPPQINISDCFIVQNNLRPGSEGGPPESKVTATCKDIDYIWNGTRWFPETQNNGEPNNQGSSENQGSGNSGGGGSNNPLRRN